MNLHATKILIVEDVAEMREWLASLLLEAGLEVSGKAQNIWEARLELERRRPDWALLDEVLPGESAYDFIPELVSAGVGVILMTGITLAAAELPDGVVTRVAKPDLEAGNQEKATWKKAILDASNRDLVEPRLRARRP